jgi:Tol biopolymer transport system component
MLAYVPGPTASGIGPIHWIDRRGNTLTLRAKVANWSNIRFSPDGGRLALEILDGQNDIWVYEWARDSLTRLTFDPASDETPIWTPDGRRIVFASTRGNSGMTNLYWQAADGSDEAQRLTTSRNEQRPGSWHPTGQFLAFEEFGQTTHSDIMILPFERDGRGGWKAGAPTPFLNTTFSERDPAFSPDGHWIAYASDETGKDEVYVQSFPRGGGKWQVSTGGGSFPTWSPVTHELLYSNLSRQIMVVPFSDERGSFRAETPRAWPGARAAPRGQWRMFDVHPDGQRLALRLLTPPSDDSARERLIVMTNFFDELKKLVPPTK